MDYKMVKLGTVISQAKNIRCGEHNYPVLSMTMHDGLIFQDDKFKKVIASANRSEYKVVYRNQLVVSFPIDEGVLAAQRITDVGIVSPAYTIWDIDQAKILPEFLEYALRCDRSINYYKAKLRGSTARRRSLPTPTLLEHTIPLPAIDAQRYILEIIHKSRNVLETRKIQLQKLDMLVRARFVELFGDPDNNEKSWDIDKMEHLCEVGSSKRIYQNEQSMEGVPFLRISDLVNRIDTGSKKCDLYIPIEKFAELKEQGLVPRSGDILLTARGTLGRCYIVQSDDEFYFQDGMITWLSNYDRRITALYISYLFEMPGFRKQIDALQAGSTVAYMSISMTKKLNIMVPPIELQNQFADFVKQVDKSKDSVQKALDEAQLLFDSLMQQYFG